MRAVRAKARCAHATSWLQIHHLTAYTTDNYRNPRTDIKNTISRTDWFFFARNSFSSSQPPCDMKTGV